MSKLDTALEEDRIAESDHTAITEYMTYKTRRVGGSGTVKTYLSRLCSSVERAHKPLVDFDGVADIEELLDRHEAAGATTATALDSHASALRGFYKWLDGTQEYGAYRWRQFIENVEPSSQNPGTDTAFVLDSEELQVLQDATRVIRLSSRFSRTPASGSHSPSG